MATIGISYCRDGMVKIILGSSVYSIDIGMPKDPAFILGTVFEGGLLISLEDLTAAGIAALLVAALAFFFQYTTVGRALRAVADDHQAAQSIGIPLNRIWVVVWTVARSEEHTSDLQSLMRISYAVFCLKKKKTQQH